MNMITDFLEYIVCICVFCMYSLYCKLCNCTVTEHCYLHTDPIVYTYYTVRSKRSFHHFCIPQVLHVYGFFSGDLRP